MKTDNKLFQQSRFIYPPNNIKSLLHPLILAAVYGLPKPIPFAMIN